jgi:hypothetical protein
LTPIVNKKINPTINNKGVSKINEPPQVVVESLKEHYPNK